MAQSDLLCANLALRLLGSRKVLTGLSDTSTEGLACNANIDDCKKTLLRMHPWNFAIKRTVLEPVYLTLASTANNAGLVEVTTATHGYATGDRVLIEDAQGDASVNGSWLITVVSATKFTLNDSTFSVAITPATGTVTRSATFGYGYRIAMPADMLRLLDINAGNTSSDWRLEGGYILTDSTELNLRYVANVTDYTTMDALFYQTLAHYLAYNLCDHITASDGKKNELHAYLYGGQGKRGVLQQARFADATEDSQQILEANDWLEARNGTGLNPARNFS